MAAVPDPTAPVADAEDQAELAHAPKWVPTILLHIFYPESRKVGFGWWLFNLASLAAFFLKGPDGKPFLDASTWLICAAFASALIGGGTIADAKHDLEMAKVQASNAPAAS
jgi:hypothetical protein